jgi:hypothetical protein
LQEGVARMQRSEIWDSLDADPGLRCAPGYYAAVFLK